MAWAMPASLMLGKLALLLGRPEAADDLLDEAEQALPRDHLLLGRISELRAKA